MEFFLPSEIARLVYGYMKIQGCDESADMFLTSSQYLKECLEMKGKKRSFRTTINGLTLQDIMDEYISLCNVIMCAVESSPSDENFLRKYKRMVPLLQELLNTNTTIKSPNCITLEHTNENHDNKQNIKSVSSVDYSHSNQIVCSPAQYSHINQIICSPAEYSHANQMICSPVEYSHTNQIVCSSIVEIVQKDESQENTGNQISQYSAADKVVELHITEPNNIDVSNKLDDSRKRPEIQNNLHRTPPSIIKYEMQVSNFKNYSPRDLAVTPQKRPKFLKNIDFGSTAADLIPPSVAKSETKFSNFKNYSPRDLAVTPQKSPKYVKKINSSYSPRDLAVTPQKSPKYVKKINSSAKAADSEMLTEKLQTVKKSKTENVEITDTAHKRYVNFTLHLQPIPEVCIYNKYSLNDNYDRNGELMPLSNENIRTKLVDNNLSLKPTNIVVDDSKSNSTEQKFQNCIPAKNSSPFVKNHSNHDHEYYSLYRKRSHSNHYSSNTRKRTTDDDDRKEYKFRNSKYVYRSRYFDRDKLQ